MAFQFRRGTDAERQSITPEAGEPLFVTDTGRVYVGNGTTQGGLLVSTALSDDETPTLSGNLDLNNNDIVGTGNINIDGFITATGNINLGDGAEDNIIVGGVIGSSLIPDSDAEYDLGDSLSVWRNGYFSGINVDGELSASTIKTERILGNDSTILYDGVNLNVEAIIADTIEATELIETQNILVDSIYSQDSVQLFDATQQLLTSNFQGDLLDVDFTVLIDSDTGDADLQTALVRNLVTDTITPPDDLLRIQNENAGVSTSAVITSIDEFSLFTLTRSSDSDLSTFTGSLGRLQFGRSDINGNLSTVVLNGTKDALYIGTSLVTPGEATEAKFLTWGEEQLGIGTFVPEATLDVRGDTVIQGFTQFGSFTTTERDSIGAQNGMVIYNTTDNRFQGYQNNAWINLDDGSPA